MSLSRCAVGNGCEEIRKMLDRIALAVKEMHATLDTLYSWQRTCPICGAFLEKTNPKDPWRCACGWGE